MKLENFKERYIDARQSDDLFSGSDDIEFCQYPLEILQDSSLSFEEINFLNKVGLPRQAAPYLKFENIYEKMPEIAETFDDLICLGFASRQRLIALDKAHGDIFCLEFAGEEISFLPINLSLERFAECICLFEEWTDKTNLPECYHAMSLADPLLDSAEENFWKQETEGFLDNVLAALNKAVKEQP